MAMQSSNPVFGQSPALKTPTPQQLQEMYDAPQRLTMDDVVNRTGMLLGLLVLTGAGAWVLDAGPGLVFGSALVGFVLAMVNIFKREVSPGLVIAYATVEGVFVGGVSKAYNDVPGWEGLPLQAAVGTAVVFGSVLWAYKSGKLRATARFAKIVTLSFLGLFGLLIVDLLVNVFDGSGHGLGLRDGSGMAILFSLAFIVVGSLTFVLDFDQADRMIAAGVPERESWRIAFGLVVGLVWLYLEILRLLSYFRD
jgi:uncharacterized YccA/Bax inhibitor family protein